MCLKVIQCQDVGLIVVILETIFCHGNVHLGFKKQCTFVRMFQQIGASYNGPWPIQLVKLMFVFAINTHLQTHFLFGAKMEITQSIFMPKNTNMDTKGILVLCSRNYATRTAASVLI